MGPSIGVAVAYGLGAPPLVLFASVITGAAGAAAAAGGVTAGPVGAFIGAVVGAEFGKLVSKETKVDIIVTPAVTIAAGLLAANLLGPSVRFMICWKCCHRLLCSIPVGILVSLPWGWL